VDLGLQGKAALVAASSKGLGRAVAEHLAAEGAVLALCARNRAALEETQRAIEERHGVRTVLTNLRPEVMPIVRLLRIAA